jgi:hypothetical protein
MFTFFSQVLCVEKESLPETMRYHAKTTQHLPDCEGSIGEVKPREYADAIDRHWKTLGKTD